MRIGEAEKRFFRLWMRKLEVFCGVEVATYCLMSNHFHLLVRVPEKARQPKLTEAKLRELLPVLYRGRQLCDADEELNRACAAALAGDKTRLREILDRYDARRHDLSSFVKELKQRFTQWYNGKNGRVGTLWEDKFHSVLVEGSEEMLRTMAAYIDLNPIRAGLVSDPKDYRWSGYGEAVSGNAIARKRLGAILEHARFGTLRKTTWKDTSSSYRLLLYGHGEQRDADPQTGSPGRTGMSRDEVERVFAAGGKLSMAEILRCRVRYFTDGGVIGSGDFVDEVFYETVAVATGATTSSPRKTRARPMKATAEWGGLRVLRDLRKNIFG